ncbi:MAG: LuxR C-terminal-related transcriptional regulator [Bacillota bacterium]
MTSSQPLPLESISEALYKAADPGQVVQALLLTAASFPGATVAVVESPGAGQLAVRASAGVNGERFQQLSLAPSASLAGWAWRTREPLVSRNLTLDPRASEMERDCGGTGLLVPVLSAGTVTALLAVYTREPLSDHAKSLALLNTVARMAGVVLERCHLRRSQERQMCHLLALHEVSRMLASSVEDQVALELAVDVAMSLFDLDLCTVLLRQPDGYLRVEVARGIAPEMAAEIRLPAEQPPSASLFAKIGVAEVTALPMSGRQNQMGYLVAGRRGAGLDPEEGQMLSIWTNLAGTALENSQLTKGIALKRRTFLQTLVEAATLGTGTDPALSGRLTGLAGAVARRLGWSESAVQGLEDMALLCLLIRMAHEARDSGADSPLGEVLSRLSKVPLSLNAAPAVQSSYQDSLTGNGPPWSEMPREAQVILAVEFFVRREEAEAGQGRESRLAALLSTKAEAGHRFDPTVVEALEAVVWARISLSPRAAVAPRPSAPPAPVPLPAALAQQQSDQAAGPSSLDSLTERELEILQFVARGLANREIAAQLFLSEATVKTHVHRILHKLGLPDRTKAAVYLLQQRGGRA